MTTATIGRVAKNIVQKIENLKENDTVCHYCEVVKFLALVLSPLYVPFMLFELTYISF